MRVEQWGSLVISLSSLMVKATCRGPLRPTRRTCFTLLRASASIAWVHMSVVCIDEDRREGTRRGRE